jgi:hypothetical protein
MTDAEATIRNSLLIGLSKREQVTGLRADISGAIVDDLMAAIFDAHVRWAIRAYVDELDHSADSH